MKEMKFEPSYPTRSVVLRHGYDVRYKRVVEQFDRFHERCESAGLVPLYPGNSVCGMRKVNHLPK